MYRFLLFTLAAVILAGTSGGQTDRRVGLRENTPSVHALVNIHLVMEAGRELPGATLIFRDGLVEAVGTGLEIPADAMVTDMEGKWVYPGFIELFSHLGLEGQPGEHGDAHWNPQVRSHQSSARLFSPEPEEMAAMRSQGFVLAHSMPSEGLFRGQGSLVILGEGTKRELLFKPDISQHLSFSPSSEFGRGYPTSAMGAIALLRQSFLDAGWYEAAHSAHSRMPGLPRPERNQALEALSHALGHGVPFVVSVDNENYFLRSADLAREFGLTLWVAGSGHEYRRLEAISATGLPVILPVNFPQPPGVEKPEEAINVSLEELRHWLLAPANPSALDKAGLLAALSSHGSGSNFLDNLRKAVAHGLEKESALAALTSRPADLLNISHLYGSIEPGKIASFVVSDGDIFVRGSEIAEVWVEGTRYSVKDDVAEPRGQWRMVSTPGLEEAIMSISGRERNLRGHISLEGDTIPLRKIRFEAPRLSMSLEGDAFGAPGILRLSAHLGEDILLGVAEDARSSFFSWEARRIKTHEESRGAEKEIPAPPVLARRFPSMEYGIAREPEQWEHLIIRNATIWTQGADGILEGADMLVSRGHILAVGYGLDAPRGAREIDASGMHLTPGLIDPHIHASIAGGVNETGDAITSETRITDVMHGDNVWIYRLLAGGITSATLFHGSANPIGGQNAVIKMRWGKMGQDLLVEDAAPGLKFALGENVKRSADRYPSSRQGTEQIILDALQAAVEYRKTWKAWEEKPGGIPPRRDLQLEAILEVIEGDRRAHVHAYRQDEMLMMMRLAEQFGFTIASFEHTLEGYKIADELREHGAAAVVWTDWSSFKVEAHDGILHNARLLNEVGVLTSLHSDNTQLSTRMNWEAAKTMMTGVPEIDAMHFITTRPATIMGIDHRTGSLEAGKDADFVLWKGHPLSSFSVPQQTWVEGRKYFDRDHDKQLQKEVREERMRIIHHILKIGANSQQDS